MHLNLRNAATIGVMVQLSSDDRASAFHLKTALYWLGISTDRMTDATTRYFPILSGQFPLRAAVDAVAEIHELANAELVTTEARKRDLEKARRWADMFHYALVDDYERARRMRAEILGDAVAAAPSFEDAIAIQRLDPAPVRDARAQAAPDEVVPLPAPEGAPARRPGLVALASRLLPSLRPQTADIA